MYFKIDNPKTIFFKKIIIAIFTLITFFGTIFGIYGFFHEKKPLIEFQILDEIDILQLQEDVQNLEIKYKDTNILEEKLKLKSYSIKLINNGDSSVGINDYDPSYPLILGLNPKKGLRIENIRLTSDSEYLASSLKTSLNNETNEIVFNKVILDPSEYVLINLIISYDSEIEPSLYAIGKIILQNEIKVLNKYLEDNEYSLLKELFHGSIKMNVLRLFTLGFFFLILLIIFLLISIYITSKIGIFIDRKTLENRARNINSLLNARGELQDKETEIDSFIRYYMKDGIRGIEILEKMDNKEFKKIPFYNLGKELPVFYSILKSYNKNDTSHIRGHIVDKFISEKRYHK